MRRVAGLRCGTAEFSRQHRYPDPGCRHATSSGMARRGPGRSTRHLGASASRLPAGVRRRRPPDGPRGLPRRRAAPQRPEPVPRLARHARARWRVALAHRSPTARCRESSLKSLVWYPVHDLRRAGYTIPKSWDDLMSLRTRGSSPTAEHPGAWASHPGNRAAGRRRIGSRTCSSQTSGPRRTTVDLPRPVVRTRRRATRVRAVRGHRLHGRQPLARTAGCGRHGHLRRAPSPGAERSTEVLALSLPQLLRFPRQSSINRPPPAARRSEPSASRCRTPDTRTRCWVAVSWCVPLADRPEVREVVRHIVDPGFGGSGARQETGLISANRRFDRSLYSALLAPPSRAARCCRGRRHVSLRRVGPHAPADRERSCSGPRWCGISRRARTASTRSSRSSTPRGPTTREMQATAGSPRCVDPAKPDVDAGAIDQGLTGVSCRSIRTGATTSALWLRGNRSLPPVSQACK